jgi:hypothetical protein
MTNLVHRSRVEEPFEQYQDTITLLESVLEVHPEFMCKLTDEEQEVIWNYYFSGRELEPSELEQHWREVVQNDPGLPAQARVALASFQSLTKTMASMSHA